MFTGIIEEIGTVRTITENYISIKAAKVLEKTKIGDSIAVNGVCLTVTKLNQDSFLADISPETIRITALKNLRTDSIVNLERALPVDGRFGGHIVSGHVDGCGRCKSIKKEGQFYNLKIELNSDCAKYVVKKGSIAVDGISLTVAELNKNIVDIAVIPHTFENTNLKTLKSEEFVNIETDILAKYVEKFLSTGDNKTGISMEFLAEHGF